MAGAAAAIIVMRELLRTPFVAVKEAGARARVSIFLQILRSADGP
jgi:hypothetical protein